MGMDYRTMERNCSAIIHDCEVVFPRITVSRHFSSSIRTSTGSSLDLTRYGPSFVFGSIGIAMATRIVRKSWRWVTETYLVSASHLRGLEERPPPVTCCGGRACSKQPS